MGHECFFSHLDEHMHCHPQDSGNAAEEPIVAEDVRFYIPINNFHHDQQNSIASAFPPLDEVIAGRLVMGRNGGEPTILLFSSLPHNC